MVTQKSYYTDGSYLQKLDRDFCRICRITGVERLPVSPVMHKSTTAASAAAAARRRQRGGGGGGTATEQDERRPPWSTSHGFPTNFSDVVLRAAADSSLQPAPPAPPSPLTRPLPAAAGNLPPTHRHIAPATVRPFNISSLLPPHCRCLLYTSDAADE